MKNGVKQNYKSTDIASRLAMSRQADRQLKSPRIIQEKVDYIEHNRNMSPLTRILGSDKTTGPRSFRTQQRALEAKRAPSPT